MPQPDVFKILKDLELKMVGLDPETNKMQEGYFISFRSVGLPIHEDDYDNPFSPTGGNLDDNIPVPPAADPSTAPKTDSGQIDENTIFAANIARSQQTYLNTFLLTDSQLRMNNEYSVMPNAAKVSDAWWAIITGANGIPTKSNLAPDIQAAYDAAKAELVDAEGFETPKYRAYMEKQDDWEDAVRALNKAFAEAFTDPMKLQMWPTTGLPFLRERDEAMDRWVALGFKEEIERNIAILAAQGTDPAIALIGRAKKRFTNSMTAIANMFEIPWTMIQPESWYDPNNDDGWTEYSMSDFHNESHYQSSSTSYGGGGGFNIGFWSAGGSFNHTENKEAMQIAADDMQISFKYTSADILRPWLDSSLLNLSNWFLMGDYKKGAISDGTMGQELPENAPAFLPAIPTSLILIKDLSISWSTFASDWQNATESTSASASVGWGPFAISGSYSHHEEQRDFEADSSGEGLRVPGIQLIGYVSMIHPLSPKLDSADFMEPAPPP